MASKFEQQDRKAEDERRQAIAELNRRLAEGEASIARGEIYDVDEAFARAHEMIRQRHRRSA